MESPEYILLAFLLVPLAAGIVIAFLGPTQRSAIRWIALAATIIDLLLACVVVASFTDIRANAKKLDTATRTFQPEIVPGSTAARPHQTTWNILDFGDQGGVQFYIGVDGINIWLLVLTAVLMVSSVLVSWQQIDERVNEYYAWLLILQTGMLGVFLAFDVILFYIFFELTLVPLFFLIGIWGGPDRRHAARKFFIFTLTGSVVTLLGLLAIVAVCYHHPIHDGAPAQLTFAIPELIEIVNFNLNHATTAESRLFWQSFQFWVFLAFVAGFAIKVPLVPVHTWLPLAHVEAPTAGSVLLAGVLLKIGSYGFLRLCLPFTPDACLAIGVPLIGTLAVIGIIYGAFCALAQDDIKKLVAYSSVSHLGFCMLGMFALNQAGLSASLLQMINHGLSTGGLFLIVGMLYERYHTRKIADYGGMGAKLGLLTVAMVFVCLTSIGLPGLNGFVGETLVFFAMFEVRPELAVAGTAGILLGAWYLLSMVKGVFFGELREPRHEGEGHAPVTDLNLREWCALAPILVLCVVLGVYPQPILDTAEKDLNVVAQVIEDRRQAEDGPVASTQLRDNRNPSAQASFK